MKFISKLNNTSKILLLALYVLVLSIVVFLAGNIGTSKAEYNNYGTTPGDENIDICLRLKERRTAPSKSGEFETQYWDFQVYLHLKDQSAIYRNVSIYTAILKKDGTMKYEEKKADILTGIENPSNISGSTSDRSIFSSYGTTSKSLTYVSSSDEYNKKDGEPDKIFVKVVYNIRDKENKDTKKTITYQCDVVNAAEVNFTKYEKTTVKDNFIDLKLKSEAIKIKVRTTLALVENENDTYRLNMEYNPLDENKENTIKDSKVILFVETSNTSSDKDNYFSDYIEYAQYYGALPYLYTMPQVNTSYNSMFSGKNLYVYTEINNIDGTSESSQVYLPVSDLPVYK